MVPEWATTAYGLSFSCAAAAETALAVDAVMADSVETTACGLSFFYSAVAEAALAADAATTVTVDAN